ncbi:hypothetical protein OH77DRAFT_1516760 [Trametes cingulata]|nr:hypothetical protein OH77DRAFT_1516760 [Trametes cingulata]
MLKRQRSSPSFVPDAPYAATPDPAIDAYERVAKRRRHFGRPRDQATPHWNGVWHQDDTDGEEDVEYDEQASGSPDSSERAQRLEVAGEYRHVNSLLHDLHAEQRHRVLFSSPFPPSHLPVLHNRPQSQDPLPNPSSSDKTVPALSADGAQASAHHDDRRCGPSFTISIPIKDASVVDHVEVQRVKQRYEDTNRYLGSLFLSRRRQPDDPNHPSLA